MKTKVNACFLLIILCIAFVFSACAQGFDLSQVSKENLKQLQTDIKTAQNSNFGSLTSEEENAVLSLVKQKTESIVNKNNGTDLEWPWFDYTYSRQWGLLSVSTRFAYKIDGKKIDAKVYGEVYPFDGVNELVYFKIDDEVIIDDKSKLPTPLWSGVENHEINMATAIDLTALDADSLKALDKEADTQIKAHHETQSTGSIDELVKRYLEDYLKKQGFTSIEWPWFDYSYTCDWDCYTETTRLAYRDAQDQKITKQVYAEVYKNGEEYEIFYLKLGDDVLLDRRDEATSENCICYFNSLSFAAAQKMYNDGQYIQAEAAFQQLGNYCGSEYAAKVCRKIINQEKYDAATLSYENKQYKEAQALFLELGDFSDSATMAERCQYKIDKARYDEAHSLKNKGHFDEAREIFLSLGDFEDSTEQVNACTECIKDKLYSEACSYRDKGEYDLALEKFLAISDYKDCIEQAEACQNAINEANYQDALDALENAEYERAKKTFIELGEYKDSPSQVNVCEQKILEREYTKATILMKGGHYDEAIVIFAELNGYSDSIELSQKCQAAKESIDRIIVFPEQEFNLYQKKTYKLAPSIEAVNGVLPEKTTLLYTSSDSKIASVNAKGQVTGLKNGTARIICTAKENPNVITEVIVHVITPVSQVKLDSSALTISLIEDNKESAIRTLTATVGPENAYDKSLTWASSNENVATVDENGVVTGVGAGQATITASANDTTNGVKKATCKVKVEIGVSNVTISAAEDIVFIGKTETLKAEVLPANAANKKITWSSVDPEIATVNNNGVVSAY